MEWTERLLGLTPDLVQSIQAEASDGALLIADLLGGGTPQKPYLMRLRAVEPPQENHGESGATGREATEKPRAPRLPTFLEVYSAGDRLAPGIVFVLPPLSMLADRPTEGPPPNLAAEVEVSLLQVAFVQGDQLIVPLHNAPPVPSFDA